MANQGWHSDWERNVYARGRQLNRYPHHAVVGFVYTHFGDVRNRSAVRVLELGCGAGNNLWFAAREGFRVAGIDGSATAIAYARGRFAAEGLAGDFVVGDFTALPWPAGSFDLALDRGSLTCATRSGLERALAEAHRVLKPGGRLLSMIYSSEHPGRSYGRHLGDNTYDGFSGGYFFGLGRIHFATRDEIDALYGSRFQVVALTHALEQDRLGETRPVNAFWKVECIKGS